MESPIAKHPRLIYSPDRVLEVLVAKDSHFDLTDSVQFEDDIISSTPSSNVHLASLGPDRVCVKENRTFNDRTLQAGVRACELRNRCEISVSYSLDHPNIIRLLGYCTINQQPCLVYRHASGGSSVEYLKDHPSVDILKLLAKVANALSYMHSRNIIHGDVKGENILIDDRGHRITPLLCDFGSSFAMDVPGFRTETGGTAPFMAPELHSLANDPAIPTKASDVWALGMTIYQLFTGLVPYYDLPMVPFLISVGVRPNPPEQGIDNDVWRLLFECWNADPKRRPTSSQVAAELSSIRSARLAL